MGTGRLAVLAVALVACGFDSNVAFGDDDDDSPGGTSGGSGGGGGTSGGKGPSGGPGASSGSGPTCGAPPLTPCADGATCAQNPDCASSHCVGNACAAPTADDDIKNGDETDVDCGGSGAPCTVGQACLVGSDCDQLVCSAAKLCQPATPNDEVKNGDETDVDCGGLTAPGCAVDLACLVATDCASNGCGYQGKCVQFPTCIAHEGGDTCGEGEIDDPAHVHESCCLELPLAGLGTQVDKYMVTAGRMRAFIEYTQGNVAGWIAEHAPDWWAAEYGDVDLPNDLTEANLELSADGASAECFIGDSAAASGARTYWLSDADNVLFGSGHQGYDQLTLDTKALNCVRRPMIAAMCAFDGKRVVTEEELREAWGGTGRKYPWGAEDWNSDLAVHLRAYEWPAPLPAFVADQSYQIAAPGRRPRGNGPQGHADLAGLLFEHGRDGYALDKGSFEGHAISPNAPSIKFTIARKYGAIGSRCASGPTPPEGSH